MKLIEGMPAYKGATVKLCAIMKNIEINTKIKSNSKSIPVLNSETVEG